jgi:hypothetical protein
MGLLRQTIPAALLLAVLVLCSSCDCRRCEREQDRMLTQWGDPERREITKVGHLVTETWFYDSNSRSVDFLWDERDCGCDVDTYTFAGSRAAAQREIAPELQLDLKPVSRHPLRP